MKTTVSLLPLMLSEFTWVRAYVGYYPVSFHHGYHGVGTRSIELRLTAYTDFIHWVYYVLFRKVNPIEPVITDTSSAIRKIL